MEPRTRVIAITGSVLLFIFVVELVRRRRLKEEYSVLWVAASLAMLILSVFVGLLLDVTDWIGALAPSSTLFFFGLLFVLAMLLHFSVRISVLERKVTALIQELGLMALERRSDRD